MKCPHCGVEDHFYLSRSYGGVELFDVKEIGKDDRGYEFVVMSGERSSDEYTGVEEESLNCGACYRIVLHDDEFSAYQKTFG